MLDPSPPATTAALVARGYRLAQLHGNQMWATTMTELATRLHEAQEEIYRMALAD